MLTGDELAIPAVNKMKQDLKGLLVDVGSPQDSFYRIISQGGRALAIAGSMVLLLRQFSLAQLPMTIGQGLQILLIQIFKIAGTSSKTVPLYRQFGLQKPEPAT